MFGTCGLHLKRRKKTSKSTLPFPKNVKQLPQLPARFDHHDAQVCFGLICLLYVKLMSRRLFTLQIVFKIYFLSHLCPYICVELNATLNFFSNLHILTVHWQNEENGENISPSSSSNISWKPPKAVDKAVFTPEPLRRNDTLRRSLQRRVSMKVLRKKMKKFQDYSLPYDANFKYLNHLTLSYKSQFCKACKGSKVGFSIYY